MHKNEYNWTHNLLANVQVQPLLYNSFRKTLPSPWTRNFLKPFIETSTIRRLTTLSWIACTQTAVYKTTTTAGIQRFLNFFPVLVSVRILITIWTAIMDSSNIFISWAMTKPFSCSIPLHVTPDNIFGISFTPNTPDISKASTTTA